MGHVCISIFVGLSGRGEVGGGRSGWEGSVGGEGKKEVIWWPKEARMICFQKTNGLWLAQYSLKLEILTPKYHWMDKIQKISLLCSFSFVMKQMKIQVQISWVGQSTIALPPHFLSFLFNFCSLFFFIEIILNLSFQYILTSHML